MDSLSSPPFLLFAFTSCQIHRNPFKGWQLKMTIIFTFSRGPSHYLHYLTQNRQSPSQSRSSYNSNSSNKKICCHLWITKIPEGKYIFGLWSNVSKKQGGIRLQSRWKTDTLCIMNLKLHIHISSNIEHNQYDPFKQQIMYKRFITDWEKMYNSYALYLFGL